MHGSRLVLLVGTSLLLFSHRGLGAAEADSVPADEKILRSAAIATDGPALLEYFRKRILNAQDRERIHRLIQRLGDDEFATREKAAADLVVVGTPAVSLLRQATRDSDIEIVRRAQQCLEQIEKVPGDVVASAVARLVAVRKPAGAADVLLAFLPFADDDQVIDELRGALVAVAVREGRPEPVVMRALADKQPLQRGAAAEALVRAQGNQAPAAASRLLHDDPDPTVRLRLALAFFDRKDKQAVPVLIDLLALLPQTQAWQAEEVLCRVAGNDAPLVSIGADQRERTTCRNAWAAWWRAHGDKLDLAKLDAAKLLLGYTLIVQMDNQGGGRVYEVDAKGKQRWEIKGLQYPLDGHFLSGDRVLIAERSGSRVTERNLKGEVLWEKRVSMPLACQRLPNGNTFIACRDRLLEVDRSGKEVFAHQQPNHDIMAAQRRRDGQIVYVTYGGMCTRIDAAGKVLKTFPVGQVQTYGGIDVLPNGRLLVPHYTSGKVVEYDPEGKAIWEVSVQCPTSAVRLPNGNTLVASMFTMQVLEVDRTGKTVWQQKVDGRPWRARRR